MTRVFVAIRKVFSASVVALALLPWACNRKPIASAPPPPPSIRLPKEPPPAPIPAPIPASIPKLPPVPSLLDLAEVYFKNGDYAKAALAYDTYLRDDSARDRQDHALFYLALSHAVPESPVRNLPQAMGLLQQLIKRFPESPYRPQAEFVLTLQGETEKLRVDVTKRDERIRELTQELERLKQIDMRRRPTGTGTPP